MDQEILVPKPQSQFKLTAGKNILIVFIFVIVAEIIWAGWTIFKSNTSGVQRLASTARVNSTTGSLTSAFSNLKVAQKANVAININSPKLVDGVDLIINYDPKILSVEVQNGKPVIAGNIFTDYPLNTLDSSLGRITVSGITSQPGGILAKGLFGSINFVGKASGKTTISLDYKSGSTVNSNVAETKTGKNILDGVNNLEISVSP